MGGADNTFPPPTADVGLVDGKIQVISNMGEENAISIAQSAFSLLPTGSTVADSVVLNFGATQAANGPGTSTEMIVYDSLGLPLKVRVTTVLEESPASEQGNSTRYRWYATSADNEAAGSNTTVVGDGILTFDNQGDLITSSGDQRITIFRTETASESPLDIELDFSSVKSLGEVDAPFVDGTPVTRASYSVAARNARATALNSASVMWCWSRP